MESKERRVECPECKELMPALLLNDLNKCDNCGCPAHLFDRDLTFFGESVKYAETLSIYDGYFGVRDNPREIHIWNHKYEYYLIIFKYLSILIKKTYKNYKYSDFPLSNKT